MILRPRFCSGEFFTFRSSFFGTTLPGTHYRMASVTTMNFNYSRSIRRYRFVTLGASKAIKKLYRKERLFTWALHHIHSGLKPGGPPTSHCGLGVNRCVLRADPTVVECWSVSSGTVARYYCCNTAGSYYSKKKGTEAVLLYYYNCRCR